MAQHHHRCHAPSADPSVPPSSLRRGGCAQLDALEVDTAVMAVGPQGEAAAAPNVPKKTHDCSPKTPHTWVRSTEDNLAQARHWLNDSARLRKAIRHAIQEARNVEHDTSRGLNHAMLSKLASTQRLKDSIEAQLAKVRDEQAKAAAQRAKLASALEAKRGPLAQAKERFALRRQRPCRETVQDDVEAALTREIAHLNAVTSQLHDKVVSVDKELDALALASAMLEDNLKDKMAALALDERCVLLDGRINVPTPPPSSIVSVRVRPCGWGCHSRSKNCGRTPSAVPSTRRACSPALPHPESQAAFSAGSAARSATLRRIADLEAELSNARRERENLEASVGQLRHTLGVDHGGLLSPSGGTAALLSASMLSPAATRS